MCLRMTITLAWLIPGTHPLWNESEKILEVNDQAWTCEEKELTREAEAKFTPDRV